MMKTFGLIVLLITSLSCSSNTEESERSVTSGNMLINRESYIEIDPRKDSEEVKAVPPKGDYIKYGFSFGECSGYCIQESIVEELKLTTVAKAWHDTINNPTKVGVMDINQSDWKKYNESIDFKKFQKLPEVIGCPDCLDGGSGWIEISKSDVVYKVTFEYRDPPEELQALINQFNK